jgi:hypothetical protein
MVSKIYRRPVSVFEISQRLGLTQNQGILGPAGFEVEIEGHGCTANPPWLAIALVSWHSRGKG